MTSQPTGLQTTGSINTHGPVGVARTVAYALAILGLDVVHRSTVRALLPAGTTKPRGPASQARVHLGERSGASKNRTSIAFGQALHEFETNGWLQRAGDVIHIRDRAALLDYALEAFGAVTADVLDTRRALVVARRELRELRMRGPADLSQLQQRHDEIAALLNLTRTPVAH